MSVSTINSRFFLCTVCFDLLLHVQIGAHADYLKSFEAMFDRAAKGVKIGIVVPADSDDEAAEKADKSSKKTTQAASDSDSDNEQTEEQRKAAKKARKAAKKERKAREAAEAEAAAEAEEAARKAEKKKRKREAEAADSTDTSLSASPAPSPAASPSLEVGSYLSSMSFRRSCDYEDDDRPQLTTEQTVKRAQNAFISFSKGAVLLPNTHQEISTHTEKQKATTTTAADIPDEECVDADTVAGHSHRRLSEVASNNGNHMYWDRGAGKIRRTQQADELFKQQMAAKKKAEEEAVAQERARREAKRAEKAKAEQAATVNSAVEMETAEEETEEQRRARKLAKKEKKEKKRREQAAAESD